MFCHFEPFLLFYPSNDHKNDVWFLKYKNIRHNRQFFCVILGLFCPSTPWRPIKSKFWKIDKNTWRFYHLTHMQHKWQSYDVWFQRYGAWHPEFFVILDYFLPCYSQNQKIKSKNQNNSENQNFQKMKNTWISCHFTNVYHKWQSHAVWFLRYGTWWTEVGHFQLFFALLPH